MPLRINVGCGQTPTLGWRNFDNSLSLRLARSNRLPDFLRRLGMLDEPQYRFVRFAQQNNIEFGDATKRLPVEAGSCDVVYSSHMIEHLDAHELGRFLQEVHRVLRPGGIVRIAAPDLEKQIADYSKTGDADAFVATTLLCSPRPRSLRARIQLLLVGTRHHQWMYDGRSLRGLLAKHGFVETAVMPAGQTTIPDPGALDTNERASESVVVEAQKPGKA